MTTSTIESLSTFFLRLTFTFAIYFFIYSKATHDHAQFVSYLGDLLLFFVSTPGVGKIKALEETGKA